MNAVAMKFMLIGFVPLVALACMVDTPVVDADENRLGEGLHEWCDSFCERYVGCGYEGSEDCSTTCVSYFEDTFGEQNETCTNAALGLMDCLDQSSCDELERDSCDVGAAEGECAATMGGVVCEAESLGSGASTCSIGFGACHDSHEYELSCSGQSGAHRCQCAIDGEPMGTFEATEALCESGILAAEICGWKVEGPGEPDPLPPLDCEVLGGSGTSVDCEIFFSECTDGRSYGLQCDQLDGCRCLIDDVPVGFVGSPDKICPFASGPDMGVAAMNYSCGFRVAAPPPLL